MKPEGFSRAVWPSKGLLILFGIFFMVIVSKLFYLQIIRGGYYRVLSTSNHIRIVARPAPRGVIRDRNGLVLADSRPAFTVAIIYNEFDTTATGLISELISIPEGQFREYLEQASGRPYRPFTVVDGMTVEDASPIADNLYRLGGVLLDVVPNRRYHRSREYCHLIGYVGLSNEEGAYFGEVTGRSGLEMILDQRLAGEPGVRRDVVDALGRVVDEFEGSSMTDPIPGEELRLTIDSELQCIAVEELERTEKPGAMVVLNYETGELLCLASVPLFDSNEFANGISTDSWNAILNDPDKPLLNRSWGAAYPPASTFKIITAAYLLENGFIDRSYMPDPCYGVYRLGDTNFHCWGCHGRLDIVRALAQSCDIYFYRTVQFGNIDGLAAFSRDFGLGLPVTGVLPGELSGLVPDTDFLDTVYGAGGWGLGNLLNISIGQGELLCSPLQIAVIAGIVASEGEMPGIRLIFSDDPCRNWSIELSDETLAILNEGMRRAVTDTKGTLNSSMSDSPIDFFGKSGTAECYGEDHALVIGYIKEPEPLAFAVLVEHGGHGGTVAAPIAVKVFESWFEEEGTDEEQ